MPLQAVEFAARSRALTPSPHSGVEQDMEVEPDADGGADSSESALHAESHDGADDALETETVEVPGSEVGQGPEEAKEAVPITVKSTASAVSFFIF